MANAGLEEEETTKEILIRERLKRDGPGNRDDVQKISLNFLRQILTNR